MYNQNPMQGGADTSGLGGLEWLSGLKKRMEGMPGQMGSGSGSGSGTPPIMPSEGAQGMDPKMMQMISQMLRQMGGAGGM